MTDPPPPSVADLPGVASTVLSEPERRLIAWLQDPEVDSHEIARRLLTDADPNSSD